MFVVRVLMCILYAYYGTGAIKLFGIVPGGNLQSSRHFLCSPSAAPMFPDHWYCRGVFDVFVPFRYSGRIWVALFPFDVGIGPLLCIFHRVRGENPGRMVPHRVGDVWKHPSSSKILDLLLFMCNNDVYGRDPAVCFFVLVV